ncbi:hypothetical protein PDJAM_G00190360 [Pangasius djambal]|uniref:Uncharacterized protein n=1 Tax=Pangasius djambal TaxID=1691987 RepID=A0ACC5Y7B7_9TELE|nr:hypothetical protein [Pangasius djambal]
MALSLSIKTVTRTPANAQIVHSGQACVVKEDNISERIYTIREGDTLVLQCLVKGHPRPQVRWTKTAGSASDKFQDTPIFNETLRIDNIQRVQGGRYYCKAENGVGVAAIKSIRVDVQCSDLRGDKHNGIEGGNSMKVEALEAYLFEQSIDEEVGELDRLKSCCMPLF